jgi:hypothetical protein
MPSRPFRVGRSRTGLGLFATEVIKKGAFIAEYTGPRIPEEKAARLEASGRNRYLFRLNSRWTVDGSPRSNIARYANHSCRPNAESDVVRGRVILRAIKTIRPGDEITYNYGRDYFEAFLKPIGCKCLACIEKRRKARAAARARAAAAKRSRVAAKRRKKPVTGKRRNAARRRGGRVSSSRSRRR